MKQNNIFKKSLLVAAMSFFVVTGALAQFSVGFELGLPMGTFGDLNKMGFGGSLRYDKGLNDNMVWGIQAGYLSFSGKELSPGFTFGTTSMIPVMGGIKYYFTEAGAGFYGAADLGIVFVSQSVDLFGLGSTTLSSSEFGISPGLGYKAGAFDISARYNVIGDFSTVGFRLAYAFGGGE